MMDTRQLEMFARVVQAGSFSAAARALHCSQPAISQQMRALERSMGGPLFLRVGRGLQLTEAGRVLAERCDELLRDLAVARQQVQAIAATDLATVRVCAFPSANASIVPQAAAALVRGRPHLRLELIEAEPPDSLELLRRAECEVVIAFSYADEPVGQAADEAVGQAAGQAVDDVGQGAVADPEGRGMLRVPLFDDPMVALLRTGHPLAGRTQLRLDELAGERWIAGCPRCQGKFTDLCLQNNFDPDILCATDDNMAIQSLVAAGLGVALAPRLVLSFLRHAQLVAVPVEPAPWRHVSAYTWPDLLRVPAVRATLDSLITAGKDL